MSCRTEQETMRIQLPDYIFQFDYRKYEANQASLELLTPGKAAEYLQSEEGKTLTQIAERCFKNRYGYLGPNYLRDLARIKPEWGNYEELLVKALDKDPFILNQIDIIEALEHNAISIRPYLMHPPLIPSHTGRDIFISFANEEIAVVQNLREMVMRDLEKFGTLTILQEAARYR